jgi:hypothetical protein
MVGICFTLRLPTWNEAKYHLHKCMVKSKGMDFYGNKGPVWWSQVWAQFLNSKLHFSVCLDSD